MRNARKSKKSKKFKMGMNEQMDKLQCAAGGPGTCGVTKEFAHCHLNNQDKCVRRGQLQESDYTTGTCADFDGSKYGTEQEILEITKERIKNES